MIRVYGRFAEEREADYMAKLHILQDYVTLTIDDLQTIKAAMITRNEPALNALLRYYKHLRNYDGGRFEPIQYKQAISTEVCAIIETYINEHKETEVETWTETD